MPEHERLTKVLPCVSGAVDVPVFLVPSLAVFTGPVKAMPVPVEVQPAAAEETSHDDNNSACLGSLPPDDACKPAVANELSQGTNKDSPSGSGPPNSAPVPQQAPTSSADEPASCTEEPGPHQLSADTADDSACGDKTPAHDNRPASSSDEGATASKEDAPNAFSSLSCMSLTLMMASSDVAAIA